MFGISGYQGPDAFRFGNGICPLHYVRIILLSGRTKPRVARLNYMTVMIRDAGAFISLCRLGS